MIQKLYKIEKQVRPLIAVERVAYRKQHTQPVLDKLRDWLDASLPQVPPKTATDKALNYLHNKWEKLVVYIEDGCLMIDNNGAENAISSICHRSQKLVVQKQC